MFHVCVALDDFRSGSSVGATKLILTWLKLKVYHLFAQTYHHLVEGKGGSGRIEFLGQQPHSPSLPHLHLVVQANDKRRTIEIILLRVFTAKSSIVCQQWLSTTRPRKYLNLQSLEFYSTRHLWIFAAFIFIK